MIHMSCICNIIPFVGVVESLEEDEGSIPMDFGKEQLFFSTKPSWINLCWTLVIGMVYG